MENKFFVSDADIALIKGRLGAVMAQDIHQDGEAYSIRSLYFDDMWDRCMDENEAGVDNRRKFRIRTYDIHAPQMNLEIKEKLRGYTKKTSSAITAEECTEIMNGTYNHIYDDRKTLNSLAVEMKTSLMRPKIIVDYERTAFVCPSGNVRITFDRNIAATRCWQDFLCDDMSQLTPLLPAGMHIMEVKYDQFIPDFITQLLETGNLRQTAFSKYYLGRLAVNGDYTIR